MEETRETLCIWHDGCLDGFGAAWALSQALGEGNVVFYPATYGDPLPADDLMVGRDVYLVDFSYDLAGMTHIARTADRVVVLDHHATAENALTPLLQIGTIEGRFTTDMSGAMLTWQWFFPDREPPALLQHISDRDLWRFRMEGTREVIASLFSYPKELAVWTYLMGRNVIELRHEGAALLRDHHQKIDEYLAYAQLPITIAGYNVPAANVPPAWASDAGHKLAADAPFSVTFWVAQDDIRVSLRSRADGGVSVRKIAEAHGGGGHDNAAGFRIESWDDLIDTPIEGRPELALH